MIDDRDELPAEENEEEEHVQFDIRQAIISSEILKPDTDTCREGE